MRHGIALAVLAVVGASAGLASAATYHYADDFARTGNLNGSSPTTSMPAATWVTHPAFTTSGGAVDVAYAATSNGFAASLPMQVPAGNIATVTVTITPDAGSTQNWLAVGFTNSTSDSYFINDCQGFLIYRDNGGTHSFAGSGTDYGLMGGTASVAGTPDTFTITLDNSDENAPTISFVDTLGLVNSTRPFSGQASAITAVALGIFQETGTFSDFSASSVAAVPEPASLGLLALGGLVMLRRKRR